MIRVFIVDDHSVVREGLTRILEASPDITCAGSTDSARELLRLAPNASWDVLILDDGRGVECVRDCGRISIAS